MMLGSLSSVVSRMLSVPMRYVGVMASLLVIPGFVMLASFKMVFRRVLVMFSRLAMVICAFVFGHFWVNLSKSI